MKPIEEWDESDLRLLIANSVEESLRLDYKQSDSLSTKDGSKNGPTRQAAHSGHWPKKFNGQKAFASGRRN
jgi:hypothetical protein